eukprot:2332957-Rhodomonas_salina.1
MEDEVLSSRVEGVQKNDGTMQQGGEAVLEWRRTQARVSVINSDIVMVLWIPRYAGAPPKRGGLCGHCQIRGEGSRPVVSERVLVLTSALTQDGIADDSLRAAQPQ